MDDLYAYQKATEEFSERLNEFVQRLCETLIKAHVLAADPDHPYRWLSAKLPWGYAVNYWPHQNGVYCTLTLMGEDIRHWHGMSGCLTLERFITDLERGYAAVLTAYMNANKTARRDMLRQERPEDPDEA